MREYELLFILPPETDEEGRDAVVQRIREQIEQQNGSVDEVDDWGNRRLAYEIQGHRDGHYVLVRFHASVQAIPELERTLRLRDEILRYLITRPHEDD